MRDPALKNLVIIVAIAPIQEVIFFILVVATLDFHRVDLPFGGLNLAMLLLEIVAELVTARSASRAEGT